MGPFISQVRAVRQDPDMKMGCAHNLMEDKIVCKMCASVCVCAKSL